MLSLGLLGRELPTVTASLWVGGMFLGTLASLLGSECGSPNEAPVALLGFADDSLPRCCTADLPMKTRVCEPQLTQDKGKCDEIRQTLLFCSVMKPQEISNKNKVVICLSGE